MRSVKAIQPQSVVRPSRAEAEQAVATLLRWTGEDPARAGLQDTPARVVRAWEEFSAGYAMDAAEILSTTFQNTENYNDFILVKNIDFISHCEHHMVPVMGRAHIAYWPGEKIAGISKLARIVDMFARRLILQETMTAAIADSIEQALAPKGVAVLIDAVHHCMSIRGAEKLGASTVTTQFRGMFAIDHTIQDRFLKLATL